jgi:hypothetical protein
MVTRTFWSPAAVADERGMRTGWVSQQDATRLTGRGIKATFAQEEGAFDRRHRGRVKSMGSVTSNLGNVLDISGGGLRVLSKTQMEGEGRVELISTTDRVIVPARVVWCHKVGFRKYVMGLQFINLTPELTQKLTEIGTAA